MVFRENELEVRAFEEIAKISLAIEGEEANFSELRIPRSMS